MLGAALRAALRFVRASVFKLEIPGLISAQGIHSAFHQAINARSHAGRIGSSLFPMTDKQAVVDALRRLQENASPGDITEELRIMAAVRRGRADVAAGRTKTHEEAQDLLESRATAWTSR